MSVVVVSVQALGVVLTVTALPQRVTVMIAVVMVHAIVVNVYVIMITPELIVTAA